MAEKPEKAKAFELKTPQEPLKETPQESLKETTEGATEEAPEKAKRQSLKSGLNPKPHYHGHRERLREKFAKSGPDSLTDYEILELALFRSVPRRDTKPIAKGLLEEFESLSGVFDAPLSELSRRAKGIGQATALDLKIISAIVNREKQTKIMNKNVLDNWPNVMDYCTRVMGHEKIEQFRILFLDKRNVLLHDEVHQKGTTDRLPFYPREIASRALELSASAIILVHNHPSGNAEPSRADIKATNEINEVISPIGVVILDHIIIGAHSYTSMKKRNLF